MYIKPKKKNKCSRSACPHQQFVYPFQVGEDTNNGDNIFHCHSTFCAPFPGSSPSQ